MIKNFAEVEGKLAAGAGARKVVLAGEADGHSMAALEEARAKWGIEFLAGDLSAAEAVSLIKEGRGDVLMKGGIATGDLLKAVVNRENGIGLGGLMSHIAAFECPNYHKLLFITDGGMVPNPDLEQKAQILTNALRFMRSLGYNNPKVAALAAAESVNPKMPETAEAAELMRRAAAGEFGACTLEGPISFDLAISPESAALKGYESQISGKTDLMLTPNIAAGNILGKTLIYLANSTMAGCILGAKVPIILTSRGATTQEKLLSLALALTAKN
ncbi:MAG: phosphate butyryltransferase [Clostridiales bacterium]|jgi:phosphate butyryltransferase|nr:phosphate butyryltransferase [Clostridiales bacterium]